MVTTIPHDPSLALGAVVNPTTIAALAEISAHQAAIDASAEELAAAVDLQRQLSLLDATLSALGLSPDQRQTVRTAAAETSKAIAAAAALHAARCTEKLQAIKELRAKRGTIGVQIESPVDLERSVARTLPLAVDSIHLDTQYFASFVRGDQADAQMRALQEMLSRTFQQSGFSANRKAATDAIAAVTGQITAQQQDHVLAGTLVLTASCTHRNASVWSPLALDLPKALNAWNQLTPGGLRIDAGDREALRALATKHWGQEEEPALHIVSGVTYGSTFIGMIHVLQEPKVASPQRLFELAARLGPLMKAAGALGAASGRLGADPEVLGSVRSALLASSVATHCSLVVMGAIPSLDTSPEVPRATAGAATTNISVPRGHTGLDVGALLNLFTRYVDLAGQGSSGVPLNYYLKPVTARELAELCLAKLTGGAGDRPRVDPPDDAPADHSSSDPAADNTATSSPSESPAPSSEPAPSPPADTPEPATTLTLHRADGTPVAYARYRLLRSDGSSLDGMLNRDGSARLLGLAPHETLTLLFPDLPAADNTSTLSPSDSPTPSEPAADNTAPPSPSESPASSSEPAADNTAPPSSSDSPDPSTSSTPAAPSPSDSPDHSSSEPAADNTATSSPSESPAPSSEPAPSPPADTPEPSTASTTLTLHRADGTPVAYARYRLLRTDGSSLDGMLNRDGSARLLGLAPHETFTLLFPDLPAADNTSTPSPSSPSESPDPSSSSEPAANNTAPSESPASSSEPAPSPPADTPEPSTASTTLTLHRADGTPVAYARYRLLRSDGSSLDGMLNRDGSARLLGLAPHETLTLLFPDLPAADEAAARPPTEPPDPHRP